MPVIAAIKTTCVPVVLEHGIKLGQRPAAVFFVEHVGEGVA
jgi:hypothetical protein